MHKFINLSGNKVVFIQNTNWPNTVVLNYMTQKCCLYLFLVSDAEVLWSFPAARGQVEDRGGSHVGGFGIMGIIVTSGGALSKTTVHAGTWGRCPGKWRFGCGQNNM